MGSIYINATNNTNPGTLLGFGTWVAFGAGRVPVGFNSGDTDFDTAEEVGGSKTTILTQANLPNVTGSLGLHGGEGGSTFITATGVFSSSNIQGSYRPPNATTGGSQSIYSAVQFALGGTSTPINNLQPYITVYMWKRTA